MADLRDPGGIQRDLFCRTVWIAESDVGRNCGDVGTGTAVSYTHLLFNVAIEESAKEGKF